MSSGLLFKQEDRQADHQRLVCATKRPSNGNAHGIHGNAHAIHETLEIDDQENHGLRGSHGFSFVANPWHSRNLRSGVLGSVFSNVAMFNWSELRDGARALPSASILRMALVLLFIATMAACSKTAPTPAAPKAVAPATNAATASFAGAAPAETNAEPMLLVSKVVFDPPDPGKDPFFPTSTRMPQKSDDNPSAVVRQVLPLSSYLRLTGLWAASPSPLAFINKTDFRPGEQGMVTIVMTNAQNKIESRKISVRCLEIRRDSVLVSVEGEPGQKELQLPAMP